MNANCPHCNKPLGIEAVSKLMKDSRFSFTMKPNEGALLAAETVGQCIDNVGKLMDASGKALGVKTRTVVEGITFSGGEIKVDFLITRVGEK